ncbi:quinone-dependent dihydroorotate dehydrogenase [Solilutibacter silvestris]|uniref:Dihydroorotate dehydrogenase (quinone) n=1 Tax=Solilutibacter silvestris TaxID=1645665 RepID=A0A2K1PYU1_9GAMM|nr:quinone-dependent dihydroorotate dehydrogenase [Lysobacter silvestris]PNS07965.1 dihydroorotate dehydrogenase (fumarate) [Lysobacter silvestris]
MYSLARPLLMSLDAERAHDRALRWLDRAHGLGLQGLLVRPPPALPTSALGLRFPNPVGLAAGLDKNGAHVDALFGLGFGFVEVGTVTPRPQVGNPLPRLFRVADHDAIINRMGFNNDGIDALVRNVERSKHVHSGAQRGILGINIGKNRDTANADALNDYLLCLERAYPLADYIAVNISSPNTAGLRELQEEQSLRRLVSGLRDAQERLSGQHRRRVPLLVKISPDLSDEDIDAIARVFNDLAIDGVIATNTTVSRSEIQSSPLAAEAGGLSGAPLLERSTAILRRLRARLADNIPMIGVGGISSGTDAIAKTAAGAKLVQLYSGLIYRGPRLIRECVDAIHRRTQQASTPTLK